MMNRKARTGLGVAVALSFLAGVAVSELLEVPKVGAAPKESYEGIETFTNILSIVQKNYVDEVPTKQLIEGAVNGMLVSLDPHSAYLTPELYKELQVETKAASAASASRSRTRAACSPWSRRSKDTPAYRAGIKSGDIILKIDGEFTKDMTLVEAVKRMRGKPDTKVRLTIKRENPSQLFDTSLTRESSRS
jgi:carboxyl-terminal processing protease